MLWGEEVFTMSQTGNKEIAEIVVRVVTVTLADSAGSHSLTDSSFSHKCQEPVTVLFILLHEESL